MTAERTLDTNQRYVRVIDRRADGFVEFTFAIGEPDLAVELLMNAEAFDDFCTVNHVTVLTADPGGDAWGLHDARSWTSHDSDTGA
jgi:phenol hydroxylase P0 protein